MPINRTSHHKVEKEERNPHEETNRERVTELPLVVHRTSQEQTLARLFFLVLFIISPRGNPAHNTLE